MTHINLPPQDADEEFIDLRNSGRWLQRSFSAMQANPNLSDRNKELLSRFLRDASLGKTLPGRAKKKIGPARQCSYLLHLTLLAQVTKKDLDALTQEDMEDFIEGLEWNRLPSCRWGIRQPAIPRVEQRPLSPRYQHEIKLTIRKFYKWLLGNNRAYPPIVEWIDTLKPVKDISALTEAEVRAMLYSTSRIMHRALIQTLFDGGFRIGELMNVRLRHLTYRSINPETPEQKCFMVRVPFSKTLRRTVVMPMPATTEILRLWLREHPARPILLGDGTIGECDERVPLFPVQPNTPRTVLAKAGRRALGKRVYPHLLRHTSATYWCTKLPYFQFCKRFGWTMTSNMPQRYIDREGIDDLETARIYYRHQRMQDQAHSSVDTFSARERVGSKAHEFGQLSELPPVQVQARTDTLINQHTSLNAQEGGDQHEATTQFQGYEVHANRQRAAIRHAPRDNGIDQANPAVQGPDPVVYRVYVPEQRQAPPRRATPGSSQWPGEVQASPSNRPDALFRPEVNQRLRKGYRSPLPQKCAST